MHHRSNGSLGLRGLHHGGALLVALAGGLTAVASGCPGPAPAAGPGGSVGSASHMSGSVATSGHPSTASVSSSGTGTGGGGGHGGAGGAGTGGAGTGGVGGTGGAGGSSSSGSGGAGGAASTASSSSSASSSSGSVCGGGMCYTQPQGGWTAPFELFTGTNVPPVCPPSSSQVWKGGQNLDAPPATCGACTCTPPAGDACSQPVASISTGSACGTTTKGCASGHLSSVCSQLSSNCTGGNGGTFVTITSTPSGACTPSAGTTLVVEATWTPTFVACQADNPVSCNSGGICLPNPSAGGSPFQICVSTPGAQATCPAPYTTMTMVIDTGFDDTRGCTACACGSLEGVCNGGEAIISADSTCAGGTATPDAGAMTPDAGVMPPDAGILGLEPVPESCAMRNLQAGNPIYGMLVAPPKLDQAQCPASGGTQTGSATPTNPVTVCCM